MSVLVVMIAGVLVTWVVLSSLVFYFDKKMFKKYNEL